MSRSEASGRTTLSFTASMRAGEDAEARRAVALSPHASSRFEPQSGSADDHCCWPSGWGGLSSGRCASVVGGPMPRLSSPRRIGKKRTGLRCGVRVRFAGRQLAAGRRLWISPHHVGVWRRHRRWWLHRTARVSQRCTGVVVNELPGVRPGCAVCGLSLRVVAVIGFR